MSKNEYLARAWAKDILSGDPTPRDRAAAQIVLENTKDPITAYEALDKLRDWRDSMGEISAVSGTTVVAMMEEVIPAFELASLDEVTSVPSVAGLDSMLSGSVVVAGESDPYVRNLKGNWLGPRWEGTSEELFDRELNEPFTVLREGWGS